MSPSIYLASNSPRRRELLAQIHVRFEPLLFRGVGRDDHDIAEHVLPGEDAHAWYSRLNEEPTRVFSDFYVFDVKRRHGKCIE